MKRRWKIITLLSLTLSFTQAVTVNAQKIPASTTIGSNPAGSLFYSVASGLAKVISGAGPMQAVVQPYTGSSTFLPLLGHWRDRLRHRQRRRHGHGLPKASA